MPQFSTTSRQRLATCETAIQELFNEVIKQWDCTVLYGYRKPEEQFELFKHGRSLVAGRWEIVDKSKKDDTETHLFKISTIEAINRDVEFFKSENGVYLANYIPAEILR